MVNGGRIGKRRAGQHENLCVTKTQEWALQSAAALAVLCLLAMPMRIVDGVDLNTTTGGSNALAFYVLGDSSVDCGENSLFYPLFHHNRSLHPCKGSDTNLVPHFLAEKMGLPFTPPFNGQNGSVDGILRGLNFGSAQATIMSSGPHEFQSLNHQLRQVLETLQLLELHLTPDKSRGFIKSSIMYLSFGKDDYIDLFLHNSGGIMLHFTGQEFAEILVNQMSAAIRTLYGVNVRKIICMGILPLGCTPRIVWEWFNGMNIDSGNGLICVEEVNELALQFNKLLEKRIMNLNKELPELMIVFCDVYQGILEIINNPSEHGFKDVKNACCGLGYNGAVIGCLYMEMSCTEESAHVWWDFYNPTEKVNQLLADWAWSGQNSTSICRPTTVQELISASR